MLKLGSFSSFLYFREKSDSSKREDVGEFLGTLYEYMLPCVNGIIEDDGVALMNIV